MEGIRVAFANTLVNKKQYYIPWGTGEFSATIMEL